MSFRLVTKGEDEFGSEKFIITDSKEEISVSKRIILSGGNLIDAQPKFDNLNNLKFLIIYFQFSRIIIIFKKYFST